MRRNVLIGTFVLIALAMLAAALVAYGGHTAVTAARFSAIRSDSTALRAFVRAMPKGADLHVHLSGAVYAEHLIAWANDKNLCFDLPMLSMTDKACGTDAAPNIADAFDAAKRGNQVLYDSMVNALSMRSFNPSAGIPSGHDQFFATFGRFGAVTWLIPAEMTAAMLKHYAADANVFMQTAFAAALARADKRVGGLNFVGPEDYRVARQDYRRHMETVG